MNRQLFPTKASFSIVRIACSALFIIVLFFSAACAFQPQNSTDRIQPASNQSEDLQGQILLWVELPATGTETLSGSVQQVVQSSLEDFEKLHPQVKVFVDRFPLRELQSPLKEQIQRGAGPDLLIVRANTDLINIIKAGLLRTVESKDIEISQFRIEALKNIRYQEQSYGLPLFLTTQVLCYNKKKVETLPTTLSDLIQQARQGYSVGLVSGFLETYWGVGSFGGQSVENQDRVNPQQWNAWAKWLRWLKDAQNEPNFILSDDDAALRQAFLNGQLAYLGCRSDWLPDFSQILDKETLGVTLLPGESNQLARPILETGIIAFSQASSDKQYKLALRLAQFLTNAEQQKKIEAAIPFIPSNNLVIINPQLFPLRAMLQTQSKNAIAISLDGMEGTEDVVAYGNSLYRQVLAGELSPNAAENEIKAAIQRKLDAKQ